VIYIIENNGYTMATSESRSSRFTGCLARRAETYGIDWDLFSDEDPYELRARIQPAINRATQHQRPTVLEISTYRYYGATVSDANHKKYRTQSEIDEHKARDPLMLWENQLIKDQIIDKAGLEDISATAKAEAAAAAIFAEQSAPPGISDIGRNVYWESDYDTDASKIGWHFFDD
jgi:pyruvate dehydrogenase E1 component alpha subunit